MKKNVVNYIVAFLLASTCLMVAIPESTAQCAMCKAAAEDEGNNGLNKGIIYLLSVPYLLIGGLGYIWWRSRRRIAEEEQEMELLAMLEPYDISLGENIDETGF